MLPFPVTASHPDAWRRDEPNGALIAAAPGHTDFYIDPETGEETLSGTTLLGLPPAGDFQLSARLTVDFRAQYDAGVLMLWGDERNWGKFCFEFSPAAEPMVVSVITRGISDDANAFVVAGRSVWLRVSRLGRAYACHAALDGKTWQLVRVFTLGEDVTGHRIGFEAQSPMGDGCTVTFDQVSFLPERLADLRDGS